MQTAGTDDDASPPSFAYRRLCAFARGENSEDSSNPPSTSASLDDVVLCVASNDVFVIAYASGSVKTARIAQTREIREIRRRGVRPSAAALDARGRHVLIADARGEVCVYDIEDVFDAPPGAGELEGRSEVDREVARTISDAAVTCAALARDYGTRGRGRGGFAFGDERGGVFLRVSTLLGHKTVTVSEPDGSDGVARAMAWSSRNVLAWACNSGVKLYDVGRDARVAIVERPRGSPLAGSYAPRLTWNEQSDNGKTLFIGWADCVKVVKIRSEETSSSTITRPESFVGGGATSDADTASTSEMTGTRSYVARVTSMFQTEYYVAGIQPFGDALAILAWSTQGDHKTGAAPELHVVSYDNIPLSIDVIATRDDATKLGCNAYGLACAQLMVEGGSFDRCKRVGEQRWWKPGLGPLFMVYSPLDVIVAAATGARETIDWLAAREDHVKLLDTCELASQFGHINGSLQDIGYSVIQRNFDAGEYGQAASMCSKLLRKDVSAWESWIEKFMLAHQLSELQSYIPTEEPTLSSNVYESVLNALLAEAEHHSRFLAAVKLWPARVYSSRLFIPLVQGKLAALKTTQGPVASISSVVLKEALAELYLNDGQRERALSLFLDIGRPTVLNFITRHNLLSFVDRSKLSLLAQLDTPAAMSLFVQQRESLPPKVVIAELLGQGGLSARELTYAYMTALFDEDPTCFEEHHDTLFDLHLEFDPSALMKFLKKSAGYDVSRACASLCGNDTLVFERVFLLGKLGSHEEAVRTLLVDAKDLSGAIKLAGELDNPVDLWNVIIKVSAGSVDFTAALLSHAKNLAGDPNAIAVVNAVQEGIAIAELKSRLIDLMDENTALARSLRSAHACESERARDSCQRRDRIGARALRRHQIHVSRRR